MSRLRDIKRRARSDLHGDMSVAALYIPAPNATPVEVTVRVWRKREDPMVGEMGGFQGAAEIATSEDRVRFDLSELPAPLRRSGVVSVESGEAYRIDFLYPADLGYQTARVVPLSADEVTGLPVSA